MSHASSASREVAPSVARRAIHVLVLACACARAPEHTAPVEPPPEAFSPPSCTRNPPESPPPRVPYYSHGKWGLADRDGVLVIPPIYDDISPYEHGRVVVRQGQQMGVLDSEGHELIPVRPRAIGRQTKTHIVVHDEDGYARLHDLCDQIALPGRYRELDPRGPLIIAKADQLWTLLDSHGNAVIDWSENRPLNDDGLILHERDGQRWALHADGRPWVPLLPDDWTTLIWPSSPALLVYSYPYEDGASVCLYDSEGRLLVDCHAYAELRPLSEQPPLAWAKNREGWGLIEVIAGGQPRTRIAHRYHSQSGDSLRNGDEHIVLDAQGRIVERRSPWLLERGPLPANCHGLASWQRMNYTAIEYLDDQGVVIESVDSIEGRDRWQPFYQDDAAGVRDVCSQQVIVPNRYEDLDVCGEAHMLAELGEDRGYDLYALEHGEPFVAHIDSPWVFCGEDGLIVTEFGATKGLVGLDGRELLPRRFHAIERIENNHDWPLLKLQYFDVSVYASADGLRYFDEPLPIPGEFPETSARMLSIDELRTHDRETLERMVKDLRIRYAGFREPWAMGEVPYGEIETVNLERIDRVLAEKVTP
jgi:hypothetical protein